MQRFIAIIIMLMVPLQTAWSAAMSLHGHMSGSELAGIMHVHEHTHQDDAHSHDDVAASADKESSHEDGHHDPHCHPVFNSVLAESRLTVGVDLTNTAIPQAPVSFYSHTPPLFDRPPLARA